MSACACVRVCVCACVRACVRELKHIRALGEMVKLILILNIIMFSKRKHTKQEMDKRKQAKRGLPINTIIFPDTQNAVNAVT